MTALAEGCAGLALVMCFALLLTRQAGAAAIMLTVQAAAVALAAVAAHRPVMALAPVTAVAAAWAAAAFVGRSAPVSDSPAIIAAAGGTKPGIIIAAVLAVLCQSYGTLGLPLAVVLLSMLLAASRPLPLMQLMALAMMQNGIALAGCLVAAPLVLPVACLFLPLPLAVGLLVPPLAPWPSAVSGRGSIRRWAISVPPLLDRPFDLAHRAAMTLTRQNLAGWFGWIDLGIASAVFAATVTVPFGAFGAMFAPLIALDGVLRSWMRRSRGAPASARAASAGMVRPPAGSAGADTEPHQEELRPNLRGGGPATNQAGMPPARRGAALLGSGFSVLAVCEPNLIIAWLAVLAAMAVILLPTLPRRGNSAVLGFLGAGLALFGLLLLPASPPIVGYFSMFAGFVAVAAVVPDLAVVLVILLLRLATRSPWPPDVEALGIGIALMALLTSAVLLIGTARPHRATLLQLSQASIAALAICTGQADGRFAALVLLVLLILTRTAIRVTDRAAGTVAIAGLGGLPPLGLFPGLVLVVLTLSNHDPWLLLPLGAASVPILLSSLPRRLSDFVPRSPSIGWLPLLLALLVGYAAPDGLVHWWRIMTAGRL